MPLRDHFRPPLEYLIPWEGFHATWPVMIVASLRRRLPSRYRALPKVHLGNIAEMDLAAFEKEGQSGLPTGGSNGNGGTVTAVWAPSRPTLTAVTDLLSQDVYEVRVYDEQRQARLVAAVEIVSPANKDRPTHRRAFLSKCAALLRAQVCVAIVDLVTTRIHNLYAELLEMIGLSDPNMSPDPPTLYAASCRLVQPENDWILEAWTHTLTLGQPLPTLPLWLAADLAVPLELEESYEQSCTILDIP